MTPTLVIKEFDEFLFSKKLKFEAVIIGGSALAILGIISRGTQDVDVLDPLIPLEILEASKEFARIHKISDTNLKENWLNHGPSSLSSYLRPGWRLRLQPLFLGQAISFQTLGRVDLIGTKILAYCDRGTDLQDCLDLKPSKSEILEILPWVQDYDVNMNWKNYVREQVDFLAKRLGYGL